MIHKHTIWKVTVRECKCDCCGARYREHFIGKPDTAKLVEAIRHRAKAELKEATRLAMTPDEPGSGVGGCPSNGEVAGGLALYAKSLAALAGKVERGKTEISYQSFEAIEAVKLHATAVDTLSRFVTCTTIDGVDHDLLVQLWLQSAAMIYPITLEMIEDWLHADGAGVRPNCEWLERHLCES